ncbi:hypothetical protein RJT34_33248 [Clitoria ternatea]|uniref:Uncharacterized protein n=1 Tax=Clitoria ternatea TaxID=43366 RepID=A0AAN9EYF2_CLITE
MDFDFRTSFHSVKHLSAVQAARLQSDDYSVIHYTDVDSDGRSDFRCPFCDFEIEVPVLCSNFEDDCSTLKNVVCPVCEENIGKDAIMQFTHSSSRKWAWKPEKSSMWSGNSAMLGKKLATRGNKQESVPDQLLSRFICNVPVSNSNSIGPGEISSSSNKDIEIPDTKRCGTDATDMDGKQDQQERRQKAAFVQNLVLSTIFEIFALWFIFVIADIIAIVSLVEGRDESEEGVKEKVNKRGLHYEKSMNRSEHSSEIQTDLTDYCKKIEKTLSSTGIKDSHEEHNLVNKTNNFRQVKVYGILLKYLTNEL